MRLFDEVAIVTDERQVESADALRRVLESYGLRVDFHRLVQRDQAASLFAQGGPRSDWTVLFSHGYRDADATGLRFSVVGNDAVDPHAVEGWYPTVFDLTPETIPSLVSNAHGALISTACGGGTNALAEAFFRSGYQAYVGCGPAYVDTSATLLFLTGLFYFLLAEDRDHAPHAFALADAVRRAGSFDPGWNHGTDAFISFVAAG